MFVVFLELAGAAVDIVGDAEFVLLDGVEGLLEFLGVGVDEILAVDDFLAPGDLVRVQGVVECLVKLVEARCSSRPPLILVRLDVVSILSLTNDPGVLQYFFGILVDVVHDFFSAVLDEHPVQGGHHQLSLNPDEADIGGA